MSQSTHGVVTFTSGETLAQYRRVKMSGATSKTVVYADAGDKGIGTVDSKAILTSGNPVAVYLDNREGTRKMSVSAACAIHEILYAAASGQVTPIPGGPKVAIALEAATAANDIIETIPLSGSTLMDGPGPGVFGFFEDFIDNSVDKDIVVLTATNGGAATFTTDGARGLVSFTANDTTAGDNDESYLHQTKETFLFALGKPLVWGARFTLSEANTNDLNLAVGLKDAWAADSLLDDGGGPAASYSGHLLFKVDGGVVWQSEGSIAGTQTTDTSAGTSVAGTYVVRGEFDPGSAVTDGTLRMFVGGVLVQTITSFDYTSATEMEVGIGIKNGDTNGESVVVDYLYCWQAR